MEKASFKSVPNFSQLLSNHHRRSLTFNILCEFMFLRAPVSGSSEACGLVGDLKTGRPWPACTVVLVHVQGLLAVSIIFVRTGDHCGPKPRSLRR